MTEDLITKDNVRDFFQDSVCDLYEMIVNNNPVIWVQTHEEDKFCRELFKYSDVVSTKSGKKARPATFYTWTAVSGITDYETEEKNFFRVMPSKEHPDTKNPNNAIKFLLGASPTDPEDKTIFLVMLDLHHYLEPPLLRQLRNFKYETTRTNGSKVRKVIVIVSPEAGAPSSHSATKMPVSLQTEVPLLSYATPTGKQMEALVRRLIFTQNAQYLKLKEKSIPVPEVRMAYTDKEYLAFSRSLTGITELEAVKAVCFSLQKYKEINNTCLMDEKKRILKKEGILEAINPEVTLDDIAGLDYLKDYIHTFANSFSPEAEDFGAKPPKAILITGPPGTGKSMFAKAIASGWKAPLVRIDVGAIMGSLIGQSEQRMRNALKQAELYDFVVVWLDEIEKALSGTSSSNHTDGGTTDRVFGTFLTWLQEHKSKAVIVATANNIHALRPELIRRFNEVFFVDLPTATERKVLFDIILKKFKRQSENFDIDLLVKSTSDFTGAEIEKATTEALAQAFTDKLAGKCTDLTTDHILKVLKLTKPIAIVQKSNIDEVRQWAKGRARLASSEAEKLLAAKEATEETSTRELDLDTLVEE